MLRGLGGFVRGYEVKLQVPQNRIPSWVVLLQKPTFKLLTKSPGPPSRVLGFKSYLKSFTGIYRTGLFKVYMTQ